MQITVQEIVKTLEQFEDIDGPIIVKRTNGEDLVILSLREYKEKILKENVIEKLKKSEKEVENGEGVDADLVFNELKEKYDY